MTGAITEAPLWWNKTETSEQPGLRRQMEGTTDRHFVNLEFTATSTKHARLYFEADLVPENSQIKQKPFKNLII